MLALLNYSLFKKLVLQELCKTISIRLLYYAVISICT